MKGYKGWAPVILAVCMVLSFYMLINTRQEVQREYDGYLTVARENAQKGIMVDALANYISALAMENTIEVNLEVGEFYVKMGAVDEAIGWGQQMVESFPKLSASYEFLLTRYRENNDFHRCYALYDTIVKRELVTEQISAIMDDIKYVYYYGEGFEDVRVFSEGYCAVQFEGEWGLVSETGEKAAPYQHKSVGAFIDGLAPVTDDDGEVYYIDNEGNKKRIVQVGGTVEQLSSKVGEVYAVFDGSTWSFYNDNDQKISGEYTNVSLLANTVAAVEVDGKWQVVDSTFKNLHNTAYEGVVQDDRGIIYRNGVIFVKVDGGYQMIDVNGQKLCSKVFEDARLFNDTTYAAVKTDKGWTFVDAAGEYVFKDTYFEDARSFSNGFAAVAKDGMWGYIDLQGNLAVDYQYAGAKDFNGSGCAFVLNDNAWLLLRLYSKNYET